MAGGNGPRRADLANRVERAVSAALTQELFADDHDGPAQGGLLAAAASVIKSSGRDAEAADRLVRAGWSSTLLNRAAATVMADIPGVTGSPTVSGLVPRDIAERVRARQASTQALIDALATDLPRGERPWVPGAPVPPAAATVQTAEFGELYSFTVTSTGGYTTPVLIGAMTNISWQASSVQDAILSMVAERAHYGLGQWIVARLVETAGAAAASVQAAISAIETAGWFPDLIIAPLSRIDRVATFLGSLTPAALEGVRIVVAPVGARVLVVARGGVDLRVTREAQAVVAEPAIAGFEISSMFSATYLAAPGSVKQVTA